MKYMKPAAAVAASLTMMAHPAQAGGLARPAMEPEVVMAPEVVATEAAATSGGFILPLILLAVIAAAAASGGSDMPRE